MKWYTASAIFLFEYKDGNQDSFTAWENVYLLEANSNKEAMIKAEKCARRYEEGKESTTKLDGRDVVMKYHGLRKLIEVQYSDDSEKGSLDCAEVTFSEFNLDTQEEFSSLVQGKSVEVGYME